MAGPDKRLEVMEDELKLLKGEVKRTLVDLRAYIMREDSPLNERLTIAPASETVIREKVESGERMGSERRLEALEEELTTLRREKPEKQSPAVSSAQLSPPGAPGQQAMAGPGVSPTPAGAAQALYQKTSGLGGPPGLTSPQLAQTIPDYSQHTGGAAQPAWPEAQEYHQQHRESYPTEEARRPRDRNRGGPRPTYERPIGPGTPDEPPSERRTHYSERRRYYRMKGAPGAYERTNGNGHRREFERTEEDDWARSRPDPDNFREDDMSLDFLDVNLVSNLVRWAVQANRRIGHERLMDLLELYFRSGHCSRELKEIISYICATVEDAPEHESSPAQEYVDLIHQLHGILAGGMAIDTERLDGAERPFAGGV